MGAYMSSQIAEMLASSKGERVHREVEQALKQAKLKPTPQLLVLGPPGSGKSTTVERLRFMQDVPFSPQEIENYRRLIFNNLKFGLQCILDTMIDMELEVAEDNVEHIEAIAEVVVLSDGEPFPVNFLGPLKALWADDNVQRAYSRGSEAALPGFPGMLHHYFSRLEKLFDPHYIPCELDILYCKSPTTGITETRINFNTLGHAELLVVEVDHHTTKLRWWMHYFQDVLIVLFLVNLSAYDQGLVEDRDANQMQDMMTNWDSICNSPLFKSTQFALLLNKNDLFEKKIQYSPIKRFWPDYEGDPGDPEASREYFKRRFLRLARRQIYVHVTSATDTASPGLPLSVIADSLLRRHLEIENML